MISKYWLLKTIITGLLLVYVNGGSFLIESNCTLCQTIPIPTADDVQFLLNDIFDTTIYDKRIFPKFWQNETLYVDVDLQLYKITDLDEISGILSLMGKLTVVWNDEFLVQRYIPGHHKPYEIDVSQSDIWTPPITVFNAVGSLKPVYDKNYKIKVILASGRNYWRGGVTTTTSCSVDASFYPFDTQYCDLIFTMWDYTADEIMFQASATELDTEYYEENEEWILSRSNLTTYNTSNQPFMKYTMTLGRRPVFFMVNMICPLVLVGLLNSLVFVLPAEAGERIGFAVNVFLTFAVFLTILAENLPKTSQPLAQLSYFLSAMLAMSSLSTLVTIFTLRVHTKNNDDPVPTYVSYLFAIMTFRICRSRYRNPPEPAKSASSFTEVKRPVSRNIEMEEDDAAVGVPATASPIPEKVPHRQKRSDSDESDDSSDEEVKDAKPSPKPREPRTPAIVEDNHQEIKFGVTWKTISKTLDKFFFIAFSIGSLAVSGVFLVPLVMTLL